MKTKTLNDLGEAGIIRFIQEKVPSRLPSHVKKGIGDDCAVVETAGNTNLLVTMDTLIEGVHFTCETMPPEALGWKALAVNISDMAAMGGTPHTAFLSLGMKRETQVGFIESFMAGFQALAGKTDIMLAGGDTVESPSATLVTITLLGDCPPEHVVYRSGARVGDDVWVTGPLGNAAAGLFLLLNRKVSACSGYETLIEAHQKPTPCLSIGKALGRSEMVHAMIDISDGIAKDLGHICEQSHQGALIHATSLPISDEVRRLASEVSKSALEWALHGGEDYELLFTAPPEHAKEIVSLTTKVSGHPPSRIGTIIHDDHVWLETDKGKDLLEPGGYVHFSK